MPASRRAPRARSRTATSSSSVLEDWLRRVVDTPGLTSLSLEDARVALLEDSLRALPLVAQLEGPIVDVGSGGGAPGVPLAASLPEREVTLLEANGRKCEFLRSIELPNLSVVQGRVEEQPVDVWGVALAKALAPAPVAAEWCLPLVRPGGAVVLWVGPSAEPERVAAVAVKLAGELVDGPPGFLVLRKLGPTPAGFPRRVGIAKKRPLA